MKAFLKVIGVVLGVTVLVAGFLTLDAMKRFDLVPPRTILGDISLAGMSREEAHVAIKNHLDVFLTTPLYVAARGSVSYISMRELGLDVHAEEVLMDVPFAGSLSTSELLLRSIGGTRILPNTTRLSPLARIELYRVLDEKFPTIPKAKSAYVALEGTKRVIVPEKKGLVPDVELLFNTITSRITFLETAPIFVEFREQTAEVTLADIEAHRETIFKKFPESLTLTADLEKPYKWAANFQKNPEWIRFEKKPYAVSPGELPFSLHFNESAFSHFIQDQKISEMLDQKPEHVRIWRDLGNEKISIEGRGIDGQAVGKDQLLALINNALAGELQTVQIPLEVVPAETQIAADVQLLGIRELVSTGYTRFEGSPVNRTHNIGVGVSKYNGVLIPPGETFSFGDNLGPVDGTTGFKKELVIKPEGTIPEYGGGLCQVSTTLYRAALYAGLPITQRSPHSYAVSYYSQVGGHGLDATVYPPQVDLKFTNDTPGHLLIHSFVDGPSAYFKLYGTKDTREVTLDGPYISNKRSAPTEPLLVPDPSLPAGQKKQVEKAHGGFDALWYRTIVKNGETVKEEIKSKYRATQNKFLVGGPAKPVEPEEAEVNPFE